MEYDVVIVGSGFGGICSAIKLKEAGIQNFVMNKNLKLAELAQRILDAEDLLG